MTDRWFTNSIVRKDQIAYGKKLKSSEMAQLKRGYLDVDFRNHPKIRALARVHGLLAQLALIDIYLAMSKATAARVDEDCIMAIAEECEVADPQAFLTYCLEKGLIELFREKIPDSPGKNPTIPGNENGLPDIDNDNDIDNESDLGSKDLEKASTGAAQVQSVAAPRPEAGLLPVAADSKWLPHALELLAPTDDPALEGDSRFLNAAQRPMRKYPLIWLSTAEFCDACDQLERAGLKFDKQEFALVFKKANAELMKHVANGDSQLAKRKSAYAYITGWCKEQVVREVTQSNRLRNSQRAYA